MSLSIELIHQCFFPKILHQLFINFSYQISFLKPGLLKKTSNFLQALTKSVSRFRYDVIKNNIVFKISEIS